MHIMNEIANKLADEGSGLLISSEMSAALYDTFVTQIRKNRATNLDLLEKCATAGLVGFINEIVSRAATLSNNDPLETFDQFVAGVRDSLVLSLEMKAQLSAETEGDE